MSRLRVALTTATAAIAGLATGALALPAGASADVRLHHVGDFTAPVHVAGAPGDGERLYVVEQAGVVKVVRGGAQSTFADLRSVVRTVHGEEGLLSIAFPPDFQTSRRFYVYYTDLNGDNRVEELRAPTGDAADPASRRLVLLLPHPGAGNHNGGQLQFGRDGLLYLAPGDGANGANARSLASPLGKLLRIDPRGATPGAYTIPADNPYAGQPGARGEIWSHGLRNPYRFTFDRATGDLVVGDVGEGTTEEIDLVAAAAGAGRGADFGWNVCEGSFATGSRTAPCPLANAVPPVIDLFSTDGYRSVIPGYVVRDPTLPSLAGRLVYGDFFVSQLRSALPTTPRASDDRPLSGVSVPSLSSFGEDAGGCVYAVSRSGPVHRLVEQDARVPCAPAPPGTPPNPPPSTPQPPGSAPQPSPPRGEQTGPHPAPRPRLRVQGASAQRALRNGGVVVRARCQVACRLSARGVLHAGRAQLRLRGAARSAPAHRRVRLLMRLTRRDRAALRRALRRGSAARAVARVRARNAAGPATPRTLRIRVRR